MASLQDALIGASGMAGGGAFRPSGLVLVVTSHGRIHKHYGDHTWPWQPSLNDIIATDWGYGLLGNIARQFMAAAEAEEGAGK